MRTDREKLIELIAKGEDCTPCSYHEDIDCSDKKCSACERAAIADHLIAHGVTVQKRGRWYQAGFTSCAVKCSVCEDWFYGLADANYCPNCGANMRGESDVQNN